MDVVVHIDQNIQEQFTKLFQMQRINGRLTMSPKIGDGSMKDYVALPNQLEFYHFNKCRFQVPIHMKSLNPHDTEWYLIHINLSLIKQQKRVQGKTIDFQKYLPAGMLLYGPDLEIDTLIPPGVDSELASIRFHQSFLDTHNEGNLQINQNLIYQDLDRRSEELLTQALQAMDNKLLCHAHILSLMNIFLSKLKSNGNGRKPHSLHTSDVKNLFQAAALLRNPNPPHVPSVNELARIAKMSVTKFKSCFKQLFGCAPMQYHHQIRMEFARDELLSKRKTPLEISHYLGYAHPSNFTNAYKKYFNVLPSQQ